MAGDCGCGGNPISDEIAVQDPRNKTVVWALAGLLAVLAGFIYWDLTMKDSGTGNNQ